MLLALNTRSASLAITLTAAVAPLSACSGSHTGGDEATAETASAIAGGSNDYGNAQTDTVVWLVGSAGAACSGTLITPSLVLTARHCMNGADNGDKGIGLPVKIFVGDGSFTDSWAEILSVSTAAQVATFGQGPQPLADWGNDVAVLTLDSPSLVYPQIVQPTLLSPPPGSTFGMAWWAPADTNPYRQVAFVSDVDSDCCSPSNWGQYWSRAETSVHIDPGDSGGPLFVMRQGPSGAYFRDVVGVDHGQNGPDWNIDDKWSDITRGETMAWLVSVVTDPIPRGANWVLMHPNYGGWKGDVEYIGPCDTANDPDCDHWTTPHDNCPFVFNLDQLDTNDDGRGDACPPFPPPPAPSGCSISGSCTGNVIVDCGGRQQTDDLSLQQLGGSGSFSTIASYVQSPSDTHIWFESGPNWLFPGQSGTFQVCATVQDESTCAPAVSVTAPSASYCVSTSGGGGGGGGSSGGAECGGHHCLE